VPAEDNRSLNSYASSLLRFRCFISTQTPRLNLTAMDAASQIGPVDCLGIIRRVYHGAKAPKWVWAESLDHRSHGGGSPPI